MYTDLLLAILKKFVALPGTSHHLIKHTVRRICRKRPSLRVIVSSATLDATAFLEFFSSPPEPIDSRIVSLEGRAYPVQMAYLDQPTDDYVRKAAETVVSIHRQVRSPLTLLRRQSNVLQHGRGDILVFLTGREEIDRCLEELMDAISSSVMLTSNILE